MQVLSLIWLGMAAEGNGVDFDVGRTQPAVKARPSVRAIIERIDVDRKRARVFPLGGASQRISGDEAHARRLEHSLEAGPSTNDAARRAIRIEPGVGNMPPIQGQSGMTYRRKEVSRERNGVEMATRETEAKSMSQGAERIEGEPMNERVAPGDSSQECENPWNRIAPFAAACFDSVEEAFAESIRIRDRIDKFDYDCGGVAARQRIT